MITILANKHTLTVERILDVPELEGTPLRTEAERNTFSGPIRVIVERRDGAFVRHHGSDTDPNRQSPYGHIWDSARHLAERLSGRIGEYEDLRYVGPGREQDAFAADVREGWHVRLNKRGEWLRVAEVLKHVNLATLRRTGQIRYRQVTLVLEGGQTLTLACTSSVVARPLDGVR